MRNSRLQNRISESAFTLPVCALVAIVLWPFRCNPVSFAMGNGTLASLLLAAITTYLVMETNSANNLLRVRSQMIPVVWVMGISMMTFAHDMSVTWLAVPLIASSHYLLFKTYQKHHPVNCSFHTFFLLGTSILLIPQLYILVPLYFWYMAVFMRCLSWRTFWAGLIGLTLPAWFLAGWCVVAGDFEAIANVLLTIADPQPVNMDNYTPYLSKHNVQTLTWLFVTFVSFVATVHYLRTYFNDKIRTRMYLYIYVMQIAAVWLLLLWQPDLYNLLMPLLMLCSCTIIAHFFALTGSIISNLFFVLSVLALGALTSINMGLWKL